MTNTASQTTILDSGERTEFESGGVRDMQKGKGRCDLLPLDVIVSMISPHYEDVKLEPFKWIRNFRNSEDIGDLLIAARRFACAAWDNLPTAFLELAIHFEEGAEKYGERNWEKGLPVDCYINSAIRHYLKWLRGDTDERHDRAVLWNLVCCIWTIENIKGESE